jgi:enoyl-CoA hydratase
MSKFDVREAVAFLNLAVPPINALDEKALQDLMETLDAVENDETVRALVIASGIKGIFCSGGNLKYWPRAYPKAADTVSEAGRKLFAGIEGLKKPSIAVIDGQVIGDGLSLALACDMRIASPASAFRLPELDYGFIPGWGTIGRLVKVIGKPFTAELLLFGQEMAAERAQSIGLINKITSAGELIPLAGTLANQAATKPPMAMLHAKAALRGDLANKAGHEENWEIACFKAVWGSREWQCGIERLFGKGDAKLSSCVSHPDEELLWPPVGDSLV